MAQRETLLLQRSGRKRIIGEYSQGRDGPTVIFLGGVHGNEPASLAALRRVLQALPSLEIPFHGRMIALAGNLTAIERSVRYVEEDLNRIWTAERIRKMFESNGPPDRESVEALEQRELLNTLMPHTDRASASVYAIDLHTTSSESPPFVIMADTLQNRNFALNFKVPIILGVEEGVSGTILDYLGDLGIRCIAFEAGQHHARSSILNHMSAIWIALASAGCLDRESFPHLETHYRNLATAAKGLPQVFEVRYRYAITTGENFRMVAGFDNFQKVNPGELLARNERGEIRNTSRGQIFMPLYQSQGDEGYFIIRKVRFFWLKISEWMRKMKLDVVLPYLPGIRQNPLEKTELIINRHIARWYVLELLHLLGYRRKHLRENQLIAIKRRYDFDSSTGG